MNDNYKDKDMEELIMRNLYVTIRDRNPFIVDNRVKIPGAWDCDPEIYPMLRTLWDKGYSTRFSCSGHPLSMVATPYGPEVLNRCDRDCYIALETNTVINDISEYKVGWAKVEIRDEWETIMKIIKSAEILLPLDFKKDITDNQTRDIIRNAIIATGGNNQLVLEMIDRLYGEAKTYILRAAISKSMQYRLLDGTVTYLDHYKALCKCRSDLIKLIEKLPENKI